MSKVMIQFWQDFLEQLSKVVEYCSEMYLYAYADDWHDNNIIKNISYK